MCVKSGTAPAVAAIANTLPATNTGNVGHAAITRNTTAPNPAIHDAASDALHRHRATCVTISGVRNNPKLPPPATNALATALASNHRTAMINKNVVPAVSRMPADTARHLSCRNVIRVLSSNRIPPHNTGNPKSGKSKHSNFVAAKANHGIANSSAIFFACDFKNA